MRVCARACGRGGETPPQQTIDVSSHDGRPAPAHNAEDGAFWMQPPTNPTSDGQPFWVDFRFGLSKVSAVDTVAGTAFIDIYVMFYWSDPRLASWPEGAELPPRLWGPKLRLKNALGDLHEGDFVFVLNDAATGRLKRGRNYSGTVDNPMDLLKFPFDMDKIELEFQTISHFSTYDGERSGQIPKGRSYRLRQIQEVGEGKWVSLSWNGHITEWALHGVSTKIVERSILASGVENTLVPLSFHVTRQLVYYFWKALLPLYLLTALSMTTFQFETDNLET